MIILKTHQMSTQQFVLPRKLYIFNLYLVLVSHALAWPSSLVSPRASRWALPGYISKAFEYIQIMCSSNAWTGQGSKPGMFSMIPETAFACQKKKKKKTRGFLRSYDNYNSVFILIVNVFLLVNLFRSTKTISQGLSSFQTSPLNEREHQRRDTQ